METPTNASRILTLVFTDLVSSTALKTKHGDHAAGELTVRHREHVERLAGANAGRIVDWAGDGCFLTFEAPSAAVTFALELQRVHDDDRDLPRVRIGIHIGEVSEQHQPSAIGRPDVDGLAVDLAARIGGLAAGDQILLSAAAYDSSRSRIGARFADRAVRWRTHGLYELKGFDKPVEICEVGLEGIAPLAAPAASEKAAPARAPGPPAGSGRSIGVKALLVAACAVALPLAVWFARSPGPAGPTAAHSPKAIASLAVLPFDNYSGETEQEYFVDGMTEALISELAKIGSIKVISRTSVMQYKGTEKPTPQIARELGVEGIIEGSVYKGGNEVRITAQLIEGDSDAHLWAASYTESLENVLKLQAKVAL